jgi:hypothetical protein
MTCKSCGSANVSTFVAEANVAEANIQFPFP